MAAATIEATRARPAGRIAWIWLLAILAGGAIHLALWPLSEPPTLFSDFMKAYWVAAEHLWRGGLNAAYPFTERGNWSNLPVIGWIFVPLVPLGREAAGWTHLVIGGAATFAAWAMLARFAGLRGPLAAALLFLFLVNGPLLNSLREGNVTHLVLLLMVAALIWWRQGREFAAGAALGICAVVKLPLLLLGVYFLARRRWRIVAGGAAAIGLTALISLAIFGLSGHSAWFDEAVRPYLGNALGAFNVQSIDGFLMRLSTGATELLYWGPIEPSPAHKIVRYGFFALLLGGFAWICWSAESKRLIRPEPGAPGLHDLLQFCAVLGLALVISPISWTHYYLLLLIPMALYLGGQLGLPDDRVTRALFWSGYVLTSLPVVMPAMQIDPDPPIGFWGELAARTIVSAWLFGALLMLACFARGMWLATANAVDQRLAGDRLRAV
jgi:alpha-1,2-mannosyltransferase